MAEKRMFNCKLITSDQFVGLTRSAKVLYFALMASADDEGFVTNGICATRIAGATVKSIRELVDNGWLIDFEFSGVLLIKHWFQHNSIRKDRCRTTLSLRERSLVKINEKGEYELKNGDEDDNQLPTNPSPRRDKNRNKENIKEKVLEKEKPLVDNTGASEVPTAEPNTPNKTHPIKHTQSLSNSSSLSGRKGTKEEVEALFHVTMDRTPKHTLYEYEEAKREYDRSTFARDTIKTMSLLDKHLDKLRQGCYRDFKKKNNDTTHNLIPQSYSEEEISGIFRDVKDIDLDNWDV